MSLAILYGIKGNTRDVTNVCLTKLTSNKCITIPDDDNTRAYHFGDHLYRIVKTVFVVLNGKETEYDASLTVKIDLRDYTIRTQNINDINATLQGIHSRLKIYHGSLQDELPEQQMVLRYFTGAEKVLEIGGNIGRNSLVIASLVDNANFVTLESDAHIAKQLEENRYLNDFTFHIENAALSKRRLIQRGWDTKPSDTLEEGHVWVNTINYADLKRKYPIEFDTLVLDCEGAFYYILMDMPEILDNIKLIIMENDYFENPPHKEYVDSILKKNNFYVDYREACYTRGHRFDNFFEVWKRSDTVQMIRPESIQVLDKGYTKTVPFNHIVIDNFLKPEYLEKIVQEMRTIDSNNAYYKVTTKTALEYNKFAFNTNMGTTVSALFSELVSEQFVGSIEKLTNIRNIIPNDLTLKGAGVHRIHKDGYLAIHTDFNTYTHPTRGKLDRRINILIYLNSGWLDSYKGDLWLCDQTGPVKKIAPILNRCVIFNTTCTSFHGHPERLTVPDDTIFRESIACYYYTKNVNDPLDFEGNPQHEHAKTYPQFQCDM